MRIHRPDRTRQRRTIGSTCAAGTLTLSALVVSTVVVFALAACTTSAVDSQPAESPAAASSAPAAPGSSAEAEAVMRVVRDAMAEDHLRSVIVRVSVDGREVVTDALGESMTGVPATTDMHFRNGAVSIPFVATALLQLVDEGRVRLDDRVSQWLPEVPYADRVTLGQLAQMTSGYPDYVQNPDFVAASYADPFRTFTPEELIAYSTSQPLHYEPGTNWNYAHTNYVILGLALEQITGMPVSTLLQDEVLGPLGLENTTDPGTPAIPEPVLHAFTSERREALGIPPGTRFYEESTYWNPSWTITRGAVQITDIHDLHDSAVAIGTGELLSPESYRAMVSTDLRGKTTTVAGCPTCIPQSEGYTYGLGLVVTGDWLMQNPMFSGYAAVGAYLPEQRIAIAVAVTYDEAAFDESGGYTNRADTLFRRIGAELAPDNPPPTRSHG